jgi:hypothetical protein
MPVDYQDIEATEPDYYKTLRQILETPLDLLMMDLTFSAEIQKFGNTEVSRVILASFSNIPHANVNIFLTFCVKCFALPCRWWI